MQEFVISTAGLNDFLKKHEYGQTFLNKIEKRTAVREACNAPKTTQNNEMIFLKLSTLKSFIEFATGF